MCIKNASREFLFFLLNLHHFEALSTPVWSSFQLANSPTASARACPRIERIHGSGCLDCPWRRMCYNARMKWMLHSFWALAPMLLLARPPVPAALPPVAHADTETVTNVPFTASPDAVVIRFR